MSPSCFSPSSTYSADSNEPDPVDDYELKRVCRKQEDRLRRLLGAIDVVAARPWDASKEYAAGMTYDQKVQQTLRETYEKCAKARKAFIRDVDEAVKNEEASES